MKKLLIGLLLASITWSAALAGDWYAAASSNIDSIQADAGQTDIGFSRANYHMAMNASGILYIIVWTDGTWRAQVFTVNDWDGSASFTCNNDVFNPVAQDAVHDHMTIQAFGDSAFALNADAGTATVHQPVIRKYAGATQGILDTISGLTVSVIGGVRGQVNVMGDGTKFLVLNSIENATLDSLQIIEADGALTQTTAWTLRGQRAKVSGGLRIPFRFSAGRKAGFVVWDVDLSDLYWADTTGWATLTTTFLPDDLPGLGSFGEDMAWMVPVVDSYFVVIWQKALTPAANCIIYARAGHITTYSGITWDAAAVTLLDAGNIPGGFTALPLVSKMPGTDSVIALYMRWADTTNNDAMTFSYRISGNKGQSWGSQADLVTPTEGWNIYRLQMPPTLARIGDSIRVAVAFTDSVTTLSSGAAMRVWLGNLITTPPAESAFKTFIRRNL